MQTILCFGDSNTWGLVPGTTERYPWGIRWTSILQDRLAKYGVRVVEDGLCGRTTVFEDSFRKNRKGSAVLPLALEVNSEVDTVILMLGTNDCKTCYGASAGVIGKGIETLLQQIRDFSSAIRIILAAPIELGVGVWRTEYDPEFNEESVEKSKHLKQIYQEIAKRWDVEFIAASDCALPSDTDLEHFTREGHEKFAERLIKKVEAGL